MIEAKSIHATLPASDIERAKSFYADKLGLKPELEDEAGVFYKTGGLEFLVYPSQFAGSSKATAAAFQVTDVAATVAALKANGVTFEDYDIPGVTTTDNIAQLGPYKGAWFKDSEGNILAVGDGPYPG